MFKKIALCLSFALLCVSSVNALQADKNNEKLTKILGAQDAEAQARYQYRRPLDTLNFFGIRPGMKVAEVLPGGGWYSKILLPYLGTEGALLGVDYNINIWPGFGFATEEWIAKRKSWPTTWAADAQAWRDENSASVSAAAFGALPADTAGSYDAVLFIRALHNIAKKEADGGYLTAAIQESYTLLKPGGVVGIVQHQAREDRSDKWANGSNGYLKKSAVIAAMSAAGFELIGQSEINENPKDQATEGDIVWRLSPSFATSKDNEELKKEISKIGESNRMTLLFQKPLIES